MIRDMRRIGKSTKVTTCERCGKANLAETYVFAADDGKSFRFLGSECANRASSGGFVPAVRGLRFGKRMPEAVYVHRRLLPSLPPAVRAAVAEAERLAPEARERYTVIKLSNLADRLSLLAYPGFEVEEHPALEVSWAVDLSTGKVTRTSYADRASPPILHRKELMWSEHGDLNRASWIGRHRRRRRVWGPSDDPPLAESLPPPEAPMEAQETVSGEPEEGPDVATEALTSKRGRRGKHREFRAERPDEVSEKLNPGFVPDLANYDLIFVSTSAGKDSQAMLDYMVELATKADVLDRMHVVHCDLGQVEWPGTKELAAKQAEHYGLKLDLVKRDRPLLHQVEHERKKWPAPGAQYCTSDHKTSQVDKLVWAQYGKPLWHKLRDAGQKRPVRVLNCVGIRAAESSKRREKQQFNDHYIVSRFQHVHKWFPIFYWKMGDVWNRIRISGVPHHYAYDLGMPRLSCCCCIYAPLDALLLAGQHNIELLREYARIEEQIGHIFRWSSSPDKRLKIQEVLRQVEAGVQPKLPIQTWEQD